MSAWGNKERKMADAVIQDWEQFKGFLAAQPLCQWAVQKQHAIATGLHSGQARPSAQPRSKDENAALMAALDSMA